MAEGIICGGAGGGSEQMTPVMVKSATAPTNTNLLWWDTTANTGGLKFYNTSRSAWEHVEVAFATS